MAIIKKTDNKRWQGCGERGAHMRCWWERKVVQPPMETSVGVSESTENVAATLPGYICQFWPSIQRALEPATEIHEHLYLLLIYSQ